MNVALSNDVLAYGSKLIKNVIELPSTRLAPGAVGLKTRQFGPPLKESTMTPDAYKEAVLQAKEHIKAGDIFQVVLSQRFERRTFADPFEVYRALRVVNPSPYMTYLQVYFNATQKYFVFPESQGTSFSF